MAYIEIHKSTGLRPIEIGYNTDTAEFELCRWEEPMEGRRGIVHRWQSSGEAIDRPRALQMIADRLASARRADAAGARHNRQPTLAHRIEAALQSIGIDPTTLPPEREANKPVDTSWLDR